MILSEEKANLVRKYIYELAIMALAACVIVLFAQLNDLNIFVRNKMIDQQVRSNVIIEANTNVMKEVLRYLK